MDYRSRRVTQSAGARSLFRATGLKDEDFRNPIIAVANSFTEFVPGHVHLAGVGRLVCDAIKAAGGTPREFNTIAVDDGIAMGHDGMLYSLPSRDLIADSVEYMVNAHCADALICISNCDKITPGMLMAGLRLNIPTIYVSGGPMEAGRINVKGKTLRMDGAATYYAAVMPEMFDHQVQAVEKNSCPTCGSCSGMFTANSMNCLAEAIGLALPGNGSLLATHVDRRKLFEQAAQRIVALTRRYYGEDDASVLPRSIATRAAFLNAISVDIAMGGSTNTILHLLAMAHEAEVEFTLRDIDQRSRRIPHICKVAPSTPNVFMEDVHRAGGVISILGELERGGFIDTTVGTVAAPGGNLAEVLEKWDILRSSDPEVRHYYSADASGVTGMGAFGHETRGPLDLDRSAGCIRDVAHPYSHDGGIAILFGNIAPLGSVVKTAAVDSRMLTFTGPARVFEEEDAAANAVGRGEIKPGDVMVIRYEGPRGGPGMQEMLRITMMLHGKGLSKSCALITDGRFSGGSAGLSIGHMSPEAAAGGAIGLVEDGDPIVIDIPNRQINVQLAEDELAERRRRMQASPHAWQPVQKRARRVSRALRAYAAFAASADRGGIRELPEECGHASAPCAAQKDQ